MSQPSSLESAIRYINTLDLGYIINKMTDETYELPQWTHEDAVHCGKLYKNFLILLRKYPEASLVPTREIDEFWHNHILYTQRYTDDCLHIFGHYLHHHPADQTDEALIKLQEEFAITEELYFKEFGEPLLVRNA